ncbi:MAG: glycosyltransferase, partial [Gammaproteobacteria bacterium]|nr:glycosyltransferase [Gammaproteobacteria bacterium]
STETLRQRLAELIGDQQCFVLPNGIGETLLNGSTAPPIPKQTGSCTIFYGSGTKTHDEDFALVAQPLSRLLHNYPNVRLILVGYLSIPDELRPFMERIDKLPPLEFETFLSVLCLADINIAPLEAGLFADCKSEIKWLEAAMCGVPSVVSRTATYETVIANGITGVIAENESDWNKGLERLINEPKVRKSIGSNAQHEALTKYGPKALADRFNNILQAVMAASEQKGNVTTRGGKSRLMFANTLYPPQALGGATSVLVNIVRQLQKAYFDRYRISVVTYDMMRPVPYQVRQYAWEGIDVTAISAPPGPEMDWTYKDQEIGDIFERLLHFQQPDIVHFHSVQRLTGSVVEACERTGTPFVVTVHDAWWLSDHQFLLNKEGAVVPDLQRNPIVAARTSAHIPGTLKRGQYLASRLGSAEQILAVSNYQADLYRRNGFDRVWLNRNGVDMPAKRGDPKRSNDKLQLGYAGGVCVHKGYFFLKSVISSLDLPNLTLTVIDFRLKTEETNREQWGNVDVTFVPAFEYDKREEFYDSIDVLIAPSIWPESFGLITREASLYGNWVVASDAGGLAEDISPGENGHTFPAGNAAALKEILTELENNRTRYLAPPPRTVRMSEITSIEQQVDELEGYYQTVLSSRNHQTALGEKRRATH